MLYRKLGRSGLDVGVVGLGAEYLEHAPRETVLAVVDEAIAGGVNYIDLFMPSPDVRDNFGIALKGRRDQVMIAGHLGATLENGQYSKSRDPGSCEVFFGDLLTRLQTDYIDVLMLHFIDEPEDYERVFDQGGLLELAQRLQKEGKARPTLFAHGTPRQGAGIRERWLSGLHGPGDHKARQGVREILKVRRASRTFPSTWRRG